MSNTAFNFDIFRTRQFISLKLLIGSGIGCLFYFKSNRAYVTPIWFLQGLNFSFADSVPFIAPPPAKKSLTPRNIGVSSEHVRVFSYDRNRMVFPITSAVEGTGSPAMSGGLPTQRPVAVIPNRRRKKRCYHC